MDERVALQIPVSARQRDEERRVREVEEHRERPGEEGDRVELSERQSIERVSERDRPYERRPAEVGGDHDPPAARHPVEPDSGRQREKEMRQEGRGAEQPHLSGAGVEDEHRDERQREKRDLVAEERDGGREPEVAELPLPRSVIRRRSRA